MTSHKVMLLGSFGVGKTSLVNRLMHGSFSGDYKATIGVEIHRYQTAVETGNGTFPVELLVWDTDGDFGDRIFQHVYIKGAAGALVIGDITRPETVASMTALAEGFAEALPGREVIVVLNKCDLGTEDDRRELEAQVAATRWRHHWTSAKTGENVKAAFDQLATTIHRRGL